MSLHVPWHCVAKFVDIVRLFRAWPHQAHFADEDINQIRKLVDVNAPQKASQARLSRVVVHGPSRSRALGVRAHRAKLDHLEGPPVQLEAPVLQNLYPVGGAVVLAH